MPSLVLLMIWEKEHEKYWRNLVMLSKLIGAQIVSIDSFGMKVKLNDKEYFLEFHEDDGDCCGFASIIGELKYKKEDGNNPVITNIEYENVGSCGEDVLLITFYGESKVIADLEGSCGSGSGYGYGAVASVVCKELDIDEILASW